MKKTAIIVSILSLFVVMGVANAQTPTKITPRQKIAAMRLAKLKKKPVVVATGSVNTGNMSTGVTCNVVIPSMAFTVMTGLWDDNISGANAILADSQRALIKMDGRMECATKYNTLRQTFLDRKYILQKVIDENLRYRQDSKVLTLQNTFSHDVLIYQGCMRKNKGNIHDVDCGWDPEVVLHQEEELLKTMTKPVIQKK